MHRSTVRGMVTVLAAVFAFALSSPPAGALVPRHDWHVTATLALGVDDTAISCAGMTCWSLEAGQLLSSTDGGATWTSRRSLVPDGIAALNDIDCPTANVCYLLATTDAQVSVVLIERHGAISVHDVGATTPWTAISCPGPLHCIATDGFSSFATHNDWDSFFTHPYAEALYGSADIGCTRRTNTCTAVGDFGETPRIEHTTNDGETWTAQSVPVPSDGMYSVTCPTPRTCYAGGADFSDHAIVLRTTDAGKHWDFATLSTFEPYAVRSISCVAATTCWAVGATPGDTPFVFATTDGVHWDRQAAIDAIRSEQPPQVSCASTTRCAIVEGGTAFTTTTGGAAWTAQSIPAAIEAPRAMACPSTTHCVALTNDATGIAQTIVSDDGGTAWTPHAFPAGAGAPMDVRCPAIDACFATTLASAAGGASSTQFWHSGDGGVTWAAGHIGNPRGALGRLACPSPTTCMVIGYSGKSRPKAAVTTDGGTSWHQITPPAGVDSITAASCSAVDACVLLGQSFNQLPQAFTTSDLGGSYEPHAIPGVDGNSYLVAVDCAGSTCLAVGSTSGSTLIERSVDGGVTWKMGTLGGAVDSPLYVDCVSATRCAMTAYDYQSGGGGPVVAMSENRGKSWRIEPIPARHEEPLGLACHADGCIASDVSSAANPIILAGSF